ncbi:alpha-L-fucosidase [Rathayibacter sp. Leaf248]|uniref:alpha-L-fucosidase n=1 Tax=Rathayibacter sp. Leaf248 TaxID=2876555 RepID=UPI001E541AB3|nr:alpha-L-fucosidase [Rathayibacter sp. Leaf248]
MIPAPAQDPRYLAHVAPSARQLAWQRLEFYGFLHFGMNTMTDREWGDGTESPALFDPADVDADEWVRTCRDAGMSAVILTCKHHDGFALWPTAVSEHSVASSPWRDGAGDLVAEVAEACRRHGLAFGVYLSPWDRAEASYGSGRAYDDFYVAQLTELLTGYGEIFCVWLDGANGEGPDGRRQLYDWDRYYRVVRALQPEAVISVCGPDVRWCGNEAGETRSDEWSVVPWELRDAEGTASRSQQVDDGEFSRAAARSDEDDLGSRAALADYRGEPVWYPAEVNTSTRPGWFHHDAEDDQVRSAEELFAIHQRAVGGNSTFLLNIPPRRDGRLSPADIHSLRGLGELLRKWNAADIAAEAEMVCSSGVAGEMRAGGTWSPDVTDTAPSVLLRFDRPRTVRAVVLEEEIALGQRIESVEAAVIVDGRRTVIARASSVGYRRVLAFPPVVVEAIEIVVTASRARPVLAALRVIRAHEGEELA